MTTSTSIAVDESLEALVHAFREADAAVRARCKMLGDIEPLDELAALTDRMRAAALKLARRVAGGSGPAHEQPNGSIPPVSQEAIARFAAQRTAALSSSPSERPAAASPPWQTNLRALLSKLGAPTGADTVDVEHELASLDRVMAAAVMQHWSHLPRDVRSSWITMLVAKVRSAEDADGTRRSSSAIHERFVRLREWAKEHAGFVRGLQRAHSPSTATWRGDAVLHWERLDAFLRTNAPVPDLPRSKPQREQKLPTTEEVRVALPALEALAATVVILGGESHHPKLERLRARTGIEIEWHGCEQADRIARRIRDGHIAGLIILDGLAGHSHLSAVLGAARERELPHHYANRGGLDTIAEALVRIDAELARKGTKN